MDHAKIIYRSSRNSFTLVEVLVSMAVLALMIALLAQVLSSAQLGLGNLGNSAQRRQNAGTVLANMAKDLRAAFQPMNRSFEGADPLAGQFQFLINPPGIPTNSGLCNPNTIFWSAAAPTTVGGTGLVGYAVTWGTTPAGAPQPLLCRMFLNTTQAGPQLTQIQTNTTAPNQWANTNLVTTYAPANLTGGYQGWLADNVIALYVRALDPIMNPITATARGAMIVGPSPTQYGWAPGALLVYLYNFAGAPSVDQYDSRQGYQYVTGTTTNNIFGPALPAAIEIAIVVAEPKDISTLTSPLTNSVYATNGYVATNDMWVNVTNYMAGLPSTLKKNARVYSTIIIP
jgi:type II secretory pathway pseudopilin PulG